MKKIVLPLAVLLFHLAASAQRRSDTLLHLMRKAGVPGLSLAFVQHGQLQAHYALGVGSMETMRPINDSTVFSAASLSKSVFSYAVFRLIREGKLALDRPLSTYYRYPDVAGDPRSRVVTARMILSHSSGLPNWRNADSLRFLYDPGNRFSYSGEGMVWLSRVVEAITGKDLESYISETIFRPLHMDHTSYVWQSRFGDNFAYPHIDAGQTIQKVFPAEANVAHSLQTTAVDYARFLAHLLADKDFLKALQNEPTMPFGEGLGWGLGFGRQTTTAGVAFWQWGDNGSFKAFLIGFPAKQEGLVYFANSFQGLTLAYDLLHLYFPGPQPSLAWLGTDSANAPDLQVFEALLQTPVKEAVAPYYLSGTDRIDTSLLSLSKIAYLGRRFLQLRRFEEAADLFAEGLKIDSTEADLHAGLAEAFLRSGKRKAALEAVRRAARLEASNSGYQAMAAQLEGRAVVPKTGETVVDFRLPEYMNARYVALAGTFNDWNDLAVPMQWTNGAWRASVPLQKGQYRYKFVVDGVWLTDTRNPAFAAGSFDSELTVD